MKDNDLLEIATQFRTGLLGDRSSAMMCAAVSWPLAALLQGVYQTDCECVEADLGDCNHIWIRLADGRALDPTADQFNHLFGYNYPPVYLGPPTAIHGNPFHPHPRRDYERA